jgi:hypothetical protein
MGHESAEASEAPLMGISLGIKVSEGTSMTIITNAMKKTFVLLVNFPFSIL